jgi:hypothetical protein
MKATTCVRVILKFRQVHVDRSHRIDAGLLNPMEDLGHVLPVQCERRSSVAFGLPEWHHYLGLGFFHAVLELGKRLFISKMHLIEESLSQLRASHRVSQFAGRFLGLGLILRSYYVRELLACWLFFSLVFGLLALIVFGSVLAFCMGERVVHWARTATQVTPIVDFRPGEPRVRRSWA